MSTPPVSTPPTAALLDVLNNLLATALAGQEGGGAVQIRSLVLDAEGGRVVAHVAATQAQGEVVLRFRADPPLGDRQTVHLVLEQVPKELSPALAPFRRLLEKARISIELDFSP